MRRLVGIATAVLAVVAASGRAPVEAESQARQTFRAAADVVFVDVSVRDGGRPVTGLGAGDFVLTDNGVRQSVESVDTTAVPIDLTLIVDLSGNSRRPGASELSRSKVIADVRADVDRIAQLLRPDDRVRLFAIDQNVQQVWPLKLMAEQAPIEDIDFDGLASLYDTLTAAVLLPVEPARRHIIIAETKGLDTVSAVGATGFVAVARQSDALLHVVIDETAFDDDAAVGGFRCAFIGSCWPTRRFWVPVRRQLIGPRPVHPLLPEGLAVQAAAEATGGSLHQTTVSRVPSLVNTFQRVFDEFRTGYMLRYSPQGVTREGWHAIEVAVPGSRSYTVRARKGYGVEPPAPAPEVPSLPEIPLTLEELTRAYEQQAYAAFIRGVLQVRDPGRLIREFQQAGNPWPAQPRREAAFAVELSDVGLFSSRPEVRSAAQEMLRRFARLVRNPLEPDVFELLWHFAAVTMVEGQLRPDEAEPIVDRALDRFPDEPRFILSRAIVADQRWTTITGSAGATDRRGRPTEEHIATVIGRYEAAAAKPAVAAEALVRLAVFLSRLGRHEEALQRVIEASSKPMEEASVRYLQALVLGNVLSVLDRRREAADAYRTAMSVMPSGQSARVALMNTLITEGDRTGAEALAEAIQTDDGSTSVDPWWIYWQGQRRYASGALARLRQLIQ